MEVVQFQQGMFLCTFLEITEQLEQVREVALVKSVTVEAEVVALELQVFQTCKTTLMEQLEEREVVECQLILQGLLLPMQRVVVGGVHQQVSEQQVTEEAAMWVGLVPRVQALLQQQGLQTLDQVVEVADFLPQQMVIQEQAAAEL